MVETKTVERGKNSGESREEKCEKTVVPANRMSWCDADVCVGGCFRKLE